MSNQPTVRDEGAPVRGGGGSGGDDDGPGQAPRSPSQPCRADQQAQRVTHIHTDRQTDRQTQTERERGVRSIAETLADTDTTIVGLRHCTVRCSNVHRRPILYTAAQAILYFARSIILFTRDIYTLIFKFIFIT